VRIGFARRVYRFGPSTWGTHGLSGSINSGACRTCGGHARHDGAGAGAGAGAARASAGGGAAGDQEHEAYRQKERCEDVTNA
jgi:hypothetical protein